jgi:flagellar basal-body rod protein FlgB
MDLPQIPFLSMLRDKMMWLSARQDVLSQNVANADTPGYSAQDVKPLDFGEILRQSQGLGAASNLNGDDPRHITTSTNSDDSAVDIDAPDIAGSSTGNTVSLESEMIKVSQTQADYAAASNLYTKALQMMRTAIGTS